MSWPVTRFDVGDHVGFVSETSLAVVVDPSPALVERLVGRLAVDDPLDEILGWMSAGGMRALPAFAMARFEADGVRLIVRGSMSAFVHGVGADVSVDGRGVATWTERFVEGATTVTLGEPAGPTNPPGPGRYFVVAGVVPVARITRGIDGTEQQVEPAGHDGDAHAQPEAAASDTVAVSAWQPVVQVSVTDASDPGATRVPTWCEPDDPTGSHEVDPVGEPDDVDRSDVLGLTTTRGVEDGPVRHVELLAPDDPGGRSLVEPLGDHDGLTVTRAHLDHLLGATSAATAGAPASSAPAMVQAVMCPDGHPNPLHAAACRVCGRTPAPPVAMVLRPALGTLVFDSGERVVLARDALIGRNPRLEGRLDGDIPELVKLPSASAQLSRTHAAIRLEGWQVLLVDLSSPNGTTVTLPGQPPRRLHADEPTLITHGTSVRLGDEVGFVFEAG